MNDKATNKWTIKTRGNEIEATDADGARVYISFNRDGGLNVRTQWGMTIKCIASNEVGITQQR